MEFKRNKRKLFICIFTLLLVCATVFFALTACVVVKKYPATEISWVAQPKTLYFVGENFDPQNAAIQVVYDNDQTRKAVLNLKDLKSSDFKLEGFDTSVRGFNIAVTLWYGTLSLPFVIDVILPEDLKTITFHPNNGEPDFTTQVVVGKQLAQPKVPTKAGLVLQYWLTDTGVPYNFSAEVLAPFALSASYAAEYEYFANNKLARILFVTEGTALDATKVPKIEAKKGYTASWRYNNSTKSLDVLTIEELKALPLAETYYIEARAGMRFDAVYIPETYTVTVDVMGGQITSGILSAGNKVYVPYGTSIASAMGKDVHIFTDGVTKAQDGGYTIAGWFLKNAAGDFTTKMDFDTMLILGDTTIYARWQYVVTFAYADVKVNIVGGKEKLTIDNEYSLLGTDPTRYKKVFVDEGKAIAAADIPTRPATSILGFDRWWSAVNPGLKPDKIEDLQNEATTAAITSKIGKPSEMLKYYETFYYVKYSVHFKIGNGTARPGVILDVDSIGGNPLRYGDKLASTNVPNADGIIYNHSGAQLNFYGWFLNKECNVAYLTEYTIESTYGTLKRVNGTLEGSLDIYADYYAKINWIDHEPPESKDPQSGEIPMERTRLSLCDTAGKPTITRGDFPKLKVNAGFDRDWFLDDAGTNLAFDASGKLIALKNCTIYAKSKVKQYAINFVSQILDGTVVTDVAIPKNPQHVNFNEPFELPAQYSHWNSTDKTQIQGFLDPTGKWEIEGYYKDAEFNRPYYFKKFTNADNVTLDVSEETFTAAATVYVRWMRVATSGLSFVKVSNSVCEGFLVKEGSAALKALDEIVVCEKYQGLPVITIGIDAFNGYNFSKIYLPATIAEIQNGAFQNCSKLATIPSVAQSAKLGEKVFHATSWYQSAWAAANTSGQKYILLGTTFYEYKNADTATSFVVPEGVETIGTRAFEQSQHLTQVVLPLSLRILRNQAFYSVLNLSSITTAGFVPAHPSSPSRALSNINLVEAGAFYKLPALQTLDIWGANYKTFDHVLYLCDSLGEKNSLVCYPANRAAEQYNKDGTYYTYYIVEESVASIESEAFYECHINYLVFQRGKTQAAISATTVPSDFMLGFSTDLRNILVPYVIASGESLPSINPFYGVHNEIWKGLIASAAGKIIADAFEVSFRSPQKADGTWDDIKYISFGDVFAGYLPKDAKTLRLSGLFSNYTIDTKQFSGAIAEGSRVFYAQTVYASWQADLTFSLRTGVVVSFAVDLNAKLSAAQLQSVGIPPIVGKNSMWSGTFSVWDSVANVYVDRALTFDFAKDAVTYGGRYVILDTIIRYHVYFKDTHPDGTAYLKEITLDYGGNISLVPTDPTFVENPSRANIDFAGWYLGTAGGLTLSTPVLVTSNTKFDEDLTKHTPNVVEADSRISVYLYARWFVTVSFYGATVADNGTVTPTDTIKYTTRGYYGTNIAPGLPDPYDGFVGSWANKLPNGTLQDVDMAVFQNVSTSFAVYSNYKRQIVTVTFDVNGGQGTNTVLSDIAYGKPVAVAVKEPTKAGEMFEDWYYDNTTFKHRYSKKDIFKANTTLYARYIAQSDNYFEPTGANSSGLWFECIDPHQQPGYRSYILKSAKDFIGTVLYVPTEVRGKYTNDAGQEVTGVLGTVRQIGSGAFNSNERLEHIILGQSIESVPIESFRFTKKLTKISVESTNPHFRGVDGVLFGSTRLIKYPSCKVGDVYTVPENMSIDNYAFEDATNLHKIIFTSMSVPKLGTGSFSGITNFDGFKIHVPTEKVAVYRSNAEWISVLGAANIDKIVVGSKITVEFRNPMTDAVAKTVTIEMNGSVALPTDVQPTVAGYTFAGVWCTDRAGIKGYVFGQSLTEPLVLYARMVRNGTVGLLYEQIAAAGGGILGYSVSLGTAIAKDIVISNFYQGYPVLEIKNNGFLNATITSIELPYTLKKINDGALKGLKQLSKVSLDQNVVASTAFSVVEDILYNKDGTTLLLFPATKAAKPNANYNVPTFIAPLNVTAIADNAFYANTTLSQIILQGGVTNIGYNAFQLSTKLTKISLLSANMVQLSDINAFSETNAALKIFVPRDILANYKAGGSGWSALGEKLFGHQAEVAFYINNALWKTVLVDTFQYMVEPDYTGSPIFSDPTQLFTGWKKEDGTDWHFDSIQVTKDIRLNALFVLATDQAYFTDYTPSEATASISYKSTSPKDVSSIAIPSKLGAKSVTSIAFEGFKDLVNLIKVVLPASIMTISSGAFKGCARLQSISLPEKCQNIEANAFEGCTSLTSIRLPSNLTELKDGVFKNCSSLTNFDFALSGITRIGNETFYGATALKTIQLPASIVSIGARAFYNDRNITALELPRSLVLIGEQAFYGMTALASVQFLGNEVTDIGIGAFQECTALTTITLPIKLTIIQANTFRGAVQLSSIFIPNLVTDIADSAFRGCGKLISVTGGVALRSIYSNAFSGAAFSEIILPTTLQTLASQAFSDNNNLQKVYISSMLANIGERIFVNSNNAKVYTDTAEMLKVLTDSPNFTVAEKARMKVRYATVTYQYVGDAGQALSKVFARNQTDAKIVEQVLADLGTPVVPSGEIYRYELSFWTYDVEITTPTGAKQIVAVRWDFQSTLLSKDTVLTARYGVTTKIAGDTVDGLIYRLLGDGTYEVAGVSGGLINQQRIIVPSYKDYRAITSLGSGFLNKARVVSAVVIPETVVDIKPDALRAPTLERVLLVNNSDTNLNFRMENDALYKIVEQGGQQKTMLLRYPSKKIGTNGIYALNQPTFRVGGVVPQLISISQYAFEFNEISEFQVDAGLNSLFHAFDSVLYNSDISTMISYPNRKSLLATSGIFTIPGTVSNIYSSALSLTVASEIQKFAVESTGSGTYLVDEMGVLFRKDTSPAAGTYYTLVRVPVKLAARDYDVGATLKDGGASVTVSYIGEGAFVNTQNLYSVTFLNEGTIPVLNSTDAFYNCNAYILVTNLLMADYQAAQNWKDIQLFKRDSYITYNTAGIIPKRYADAEKPEGFVGEADGFVKMMRTTSYFLPLEIALPASLKGLYRMPYSDKEGWYYDSALTQKVDMTNDIITSDTTLYVKWVVDSRAVLSTGAGAQEKQYFAFHEVIEGGIPVAYEVSLNVTSGIKELQTIVIPSYYRGLPVVGFHVSAHYAYSGFLKLKTLVLPETFNNFINIFAKEGGVEVVKQENISRLVILSRKVLQMRSPGATLENDKELVDFVAMCGNIDYHFLDGEIYDAYKRNKFWGSSVGIRGILSNEVVTFKVPDPTNTSGIETFLPNSEFYVNYEINGEMLRDYNNALSAPEVLGYTFDGWYQRLTGGGEKKFEMTDIIKQNRLNTQQLAPIVLYAKYTKEPAAP